MKVKREQQEVARAKKGPVRFMSCQSAGAHRLLIPVLPCHLQDVKGARQSWAKAQVAHEAASARAMLDEELRSEMQQVTYPSRTQRAPGLERCPTMLAW